MNRKYKIILLERKVGHWVQLDNPYDSTDQAHYYFMTETDMVEVEHWVEENNLGKRMAFAMWQLKSQEAVTAFMLKWGQ